MIRALLAAVALLATAACSRASAPRSSGATVLSYASPYPPGHPFSRADLRWIAWVEKTSGGRLRIRRARGVFSARPRLGHEDAAPALGAPGRRRPG